jgi:hypothetical protein
MAWPLEECSSLDTVIVATFAYTLPSTSARGEYDGIRLIIFPIFLALLVLCLAVYSIPVAFAQDEGPTGGVPTEWIYGVWAAVKAAPIAIVVALVTCLAGFLSKTPPENFSLSKFIATAFISLLIGFLTVFAGWNYTMVQEWFANGFMPWYIWKAAEIVARIIGKKFSLASNTQPPTTATT